MTKFELYFDDDNNKFVAVNPETGEVKDLTVKKPATKKASSKKKDENPNPEIILEENKYSLNTAALELLKAEAGDRLVIRMLHGTPTIGTNKAFGLGEDAGNKLTKSGTIACRGKAHEELSRYGTIFSLVATDKEGQFTMKGDVPELPKETEEIANPEDIDDIDDLIDIDEVENNEDSDSNFNFNL